MRTARVDNTTGKIKEIAQQEQLGDLVAAEGETLFLLLSYPQLSRVSDAQLLADYSYDFPTSAWVANIPIPPLDIMKSDKLTEIKSAFGQALRKGYTVTAGLKMDADFGSISNLSALKTLAELTGLTTVTIRDYDNVSHEITLTGLTDLLIELGVNAQILYQRKWTLSDATTNATTAADVAAINW